MRNEGVNPSKHGLSEHGFSAGTAFWNQDSRHLTAEALRRREGVRSSNGALAVRTGQFTGRSPGDKFVVRDEVTEAHVDWGAVNQPMSPAQFDALYERVIRSLDGTELFVQDLRAGADGEFGLRVRVIAQLAWHALFGRQLFLRPETAELGAHVPDFTLIFAPHVQADPALHGSKSSTCIALSFSRRTVLICGTFYAGELKKSVFTILNYLLPERGVFPMHCSANIGEDGDTALFFGLSGTGKTTLSADPRRRLIGDDEHGWSNRGVFNFEGGCYAKCIRLSKKNEPQIWDAIREGAVLENVVIDPETGDPDYDSAELTENTRAAYPIDHIGNAVIPSVGGHPANVVFLTADARGVLPPISRLTPELAMYHFLSGYTAKLAGTERGLGSEPGATFSSCFGAPFLPRRPMEYAEMLGRRMREHDVRVWLVNTGWIGGAYGVGQRIDLPYTRAMVNAALEGRLEGVPASPHPNFHVMVPQSCPGVPDAVLDPAGQWPDRSAYGQAAARLAELFRKNFEKFSGVPDAVKAAAPR